MESGKIDLDVVKNVDIVNYLTSLGFEPSKISGQNYWYHSPLRNERTPSFKVNRNINRWYDFGIGMGGSIIDFCITFHNCTIAELFQNFDRYFLSHSPIQHKPLQKNIQASKIEIISIHQLSSWALVNYLKQRNIPITIAQIFCVEIRYRIRQKTYYGIGFKNDSDGYEIRNTYFKGSSSPKDITTIQNGSKSVLVFEGFVDFLSFQTIHQNQQDQSFNFVVLNSLSMFVKARPFLEKHECIHLYLDNDKAGQNCSRSALALNDKYQDESHLYKHYKDLNDWLVNFGKHSKNDKDKSKDQ